MDSIQQSPQTFVVMKNGQKFEPYSKDKLLDSVKLGNFTFDDLTTNSQLDDWKPMHSYFPDQELTRTTEAVITDPNINTPKNHREASGFLGVSLGLHPTVSTLAIIVDIMVFILAVPTFGLIVFSVIMLSIITFLIQKISMEIALSKTAIIALLTGIPVPLCTALILFFKVFGKKSF
ncbi:MAG: hypothetical protein HC866_03985 [Leptolyngbyaceae cyanobacterium RU_5_1]|nr:hypothetical protein [Leptolyngbyaceae cyanobacterium RU_5_1]